MPAEMIVEQLQKTYRVPVRKHGMVAALRSLVHPVYEEVHAVNEVSFTIEQGEIVGFIGSNGAGKTTTLKVLAGLLHPTAGCVRVGGFTPWERRMEFLRKISMVMGNKSQMTWENTVLDTFVVLKEIYHVSQHDFQGRLDELVSLLEIGDLLPKMVRNLSLGERARCEFAAALLHRPEILFLDEPTLGLDVSMQLRLRDFIKEYNRRYHTTVLLTSHYMADISSLCQRVMLIDQGKLIFDGALAALAQKMAPFKLVRYSVTDGADCGVKAILERLPQEVAVIEESEEGVTLRVKKDEVLAVTTALIRQSIADLTIIDPPIEAVIDQVYREGLSA